MQEMEEIYATGTVGDADRCIRLQAGGTGEESLEDIMATSGTRLNLFFKTFFARQLRGATLGLGRLVYECWR